ncbi:MAG: M18 family aminopeptidase [Parachlamydiaceae bacterium]|nr:M18 family aminopeptidase [Parachlamydiaceae bacterium]
MKSNPIIQDFLSFLNQCPTSWHATAAAVKILKNKGFRELKEDQSWNLTPGNRYFVTRNDSSLCAFILPKSTPERVRILASHSDSPGFKIKPQPEIRKQNMILLSTEIYGSPLLNSWLNRDLGLAGRVTFVNSQGNIESTLVRLEDAPLTIPQLAVHLDREVNEKGLTLNKQEHLNVLAALNESLPPSSSYIETLLRQKIEFKQLLSSDLFLFPLEEARLMGFNQQMIAAHGLDNIASLHASLHSMVHNTSSHENDIKMIVCWDNEEIGSNTYQGVSSPFISQILERILLASNKGREDYFRLLNQSFCLSIDLSHAQHPNYMERHDPQHQIQMGKGVVLKHNAQFRYATDGNTSIPLKVLTKEFGIPLQNFVSRNDIPCGTTIGPMHSSLLGMPTVDIGCGQLSMHSCRELMSCQDHLDMCILTQAILETPEIPKTKKVENT